MGAERDGIGSVKKGDEVTVTATVSGSTATVERLLDTTELKAGAGKWPGGPEGGFGPAVRVDRAGLARRPVLAPTPSAPPTNS